MAVINGSRYMGDGYSDWYYEQKRYHFYECAIESNLPMDYENGRIVDYFTLEGVGSKADSKMVQHHIDLLGIAKIPTKQGYLFGKGIKALKLIRYGAIYFSVASPVVNTGICYIVVY